MALGQIIERKGRKLEFQNVGGQNQWVDVGSSQKKQTSQDAGSNIIEPPKPTQDTIKPEQPTGDGITEESKILTKEERTKKLLGEFNAGKESERLAGLTTPVEQFEEMITEQERQKAAEKEITGIEKSIQEAQLQEFAKQSARAIRGVETQLAQTPEGVTTSTAPLLSQEFKQTTNKKVQLAIDSARAANLRVQELERKAERMRQAGRAEAAKGIIAEADAERERAALLQEQAQIAAQESQDRAFSLIGTLSQTGVLAGMSEEERAELQPLLEALPAGVSDALIRTGVAQSKDIQTQQKLLAQQNTISSFSALAQQGVELPPEAIQTFAQQSGLPESLFMSFNQQARQIQEDKTLDTDSKRIALEQLGLNFQRDVQGLNSKAAEAVRGLNALRQMGASEEIISAYKESAGITDRNDPMFQAKLRQQQAEANITQKRANGEPISAKDWQDWVEAQNSLREFSGTMSGGLIPKESLEGITTVGVENGELKINVPDGTRMQCGEFVNRYWGLSSGGTTGMGDSLESKMKQVNSRGVTMEQALQNPTLIKPGMAFVQSLTPGKSNETGHTGIVVSVNPMTKTFTSVEFNKNGTEQYTKETRKIEEVEGFAPPPEGKFDEIQPQETVGQAQQFAEEIMKPFSTSKLSDFTKAQQEKILPLLNKKKEEALIKGDLVGVMKASAGGNNPTDTFRNKMSKGATTINQVGNLFNFMELGSVETQDNEGKPLSLDLSPLKAWFRNANPWDTDAQTINAALQGTVPNLARGIFGEVGVLTDRDIELYKKTLPNLTQTKDVQKSVAALTMRTIRNSIENEIEINAGTGNDMSGLVSFYEKINNKVTQMEEELGIIDTERSDIKGTPQDPEYLTNLYEDNVPPTQFTLEEKQSRWDSL